MSIGIGSKIFDLASLPGASRPGSGSGGGGGVIPPSGEIYEFETTTIAKSSGQLACNAVIDGVFFTTAPATGPSPIYPEPNSRIYIDAEATGYPEPGWYSQDIPEYNVRVTYEVVADGLVTVFPSVC